MFTQSVQWLKLADMEQIGGPLDLLQNFVGAELDVGQVFSVLRPIAKNQIYIFRTFWDTKFQMPQ